MEEFADLIGSVENNANQNNFEEFADPIDSVESSSSFDNHNFIMNQKELSSKVEDVVQEKNHCLGDERIEAFDDLKSIIK
jgi:hypothetical protein